MENNKTTSLMEIIESKENLEEIMNAELQSFIKHTGIYPVIKVIETETTHNCGKFKTLDIKVTIEL